MVLTPSQKQAVVTMYEEKKMPHQIAKALDLNGREVASFLQTHRRRGAVAIKAQVEGQVKIAISQNEVLKQQNEVQLGSQHMLTQYTRTGMKLINICDTLYSKFVCRYFWREKEK